MYIIELKINNIFIKKLRKNNKKKIGIKIQCNF